jgi:hypothetical protein
MVMVMVVVVVRRHASRQQWMVRERETSREDKK